MQLEELFNYKNQLMEDLLTNKEIVRLLDEDIKLEDAYKLAYYQVYPFQYVPETLEEGRTIICFDVDIQKSLNKTYLQPTLFIWIFAHKSELRLPEGGIRTDKLCSEIAKQINGSRKYGLGELDLFSVKRFTPLTDYQGKSMMFIATDFNRLSPSNFPVPSNRR